MNQDGVYGLPNKIPQRNFQDQAQQRAAISGAQHIMAPPIYGNIKQTIQSLIGDSQPG